MVVGYTEFSSGSGLVWRAANVDAVLPEVDADGSQDLRSENCATGSKDGEE